MRAPLTLHRLTGADAPQYRDLRLKALHDHPEAFGASWEDEAAQPLTWFADRLDRNTVFGAKPPTTTALAGIAGLIIPEAAKSKHKATLWGMFVHPEAQGTGLGKALLTHTLEHAATIVVEVRLTVVSSNTPAIRLYTRTGFEQYGREPRALKVGGLYHDELLMTLPLNQPSKQK